MVSEFVFVSFCFHQARGWSAEDMFEINKNKFNVTSSFDEDLSEYTYVLFCFLGVYVR